MPAGKTLELAKLVGSGTILRFWATLPLIGQRHALDSLVVLIYWDGETEPSVQVPFGALFGASFGRTRRVVAFPIMQVGGGYLCSFEMPFNDGARVELRNDSTKDVRHFFFQIGYLEHPTSSAPEATLHAEYRQTTALEGEEAVRVIEAKGAGHFVGLMASLQNRSIWLKPPWAHIALPRGFGLGLLEGWETIVVDDDAPLIGTGAEDYFSGGFYFMGAPFSTPTHGCTYRSFLTGRVSAYRFHSSDAVPFTESLSFSLDHGFDNRMAGLYTTVAFWYQLEPHQTFAKLPPLAQRRPSFPWTNVMQWAVVTIALSAIAVAIRYGLSGAYAHWFSG